MEIPTGLWGLASDPVIRSGLFAALLWGVFTMIDRRVKGDDYWRKVMRREMDDCNKREERLRAENEVLRNKLLGWTPPGGTPAQRKDDAK